MAAPAAVASIILLAAAAAAAAWTVLPDQPATAADGCGPVEKVPVVGLACYNAQTGLYSTFAEDGTFLGFTHGADPIPTWTTPPGTSASQADPIDIDTMPPYTPSDPFCAKLSKNPYHIQVFSLRAKDDPPTPDSPTVDDIRNLVRHANGVLRAEAAKFGVDPVDYRVKCDGAGQIDVQEITLPISKNGATFTSIVGSLANLGYADPKAKHWIYYDETDATAGGVGHFYGDDTPGVDNFNNGNAGPMYSVTVGYVSIRFMMHELGHNMGAVQTSSPQATGPGDAHCWDGKSIMCYADKGAKGGLYNELACPSFQPYDCNNDDFFHPAAPPGSYLYDHWNQGNKVNRFLHFPNVLPVAYGDGLTTPEGTPINILLTADDPDMQPEPLTWTLLTPPSAGTLTSAPPSVTYTPNDPEWSGIDTFTFTVNDGEGDAVPGIVHVTVQPVNDPPVTSSVAVTTLEDTPVAVALAASDVDSEDLTFSVGPPTSGSVAGTGGVRWYTPAADFVGTATFPYTAHDGLLPSDPDAPGIVTVTVLPVNDIPKAPDITVTTVEDVAVAIPIPAADQDGDPVAVSVGDVGIGTLTGAASAWLYEPPTGFSGDVLFTYTLDDGTGTGQGLVTVHVLPVDDPPRAESASVVVLQQPTVVRLAGFDEEGAQLQFAWGIPSAGTLVAGAAPDAVVYTPVAGDCGVQSFPFSVADGTSVVPATMSVDINCAPTAYPTSITLPEDGSAAVVLGGSDPDGDDLTLEVAQPPQLGRIVGSGATVQYVALPDRCGSDSWAYRARDPYQPGEPALVSVFIACLPDAPRALPDELTLRQGEKTTLYLQGQDPDGMPLTFDVLAAPGLVSVSGEAPALLVTAGRDIGRGVLVFRVDDGTSSDVASVAIEVVPDLGVIARHRVVGVVQGSEVLVALPGGDRDGDQVAYQVTQAPDGSLDVQGSQAVYGAPSDFVGTTRLAFEVAGAGERVPGTVDFVVLESLACRVPKLTVVEDAAVTFAPALPLPRELSPVPFAKKLPERGSLQVADTWTYVPAPDTFGRDSFSYIVQGENLVSEPCVVEVEVLPRNDAPLLELPQLPAVDEDAGRQAFAEALAGFHPGSPHEQGQRVAEATVRIEPAGAGTASIDKGTLLVEPAADWSGEMRILVRVRDSGGATDGGVDAAEAMTRLTVRPVDDAPRAGDDTLVVDAGGTGFAAVLGNDADPEGAPLQLVGVSASHGRVAVEGGAVRYVAAPGFSGEDTVTYQVTDGTQVGTGRILVSVQEPAPAAPDAGRPPAPRSATDGGVSPTLVAAAGAVAILLLAAVAFVALRRRR